MAPGRVARWYEMHLLDELGSRPEVDRCVECDRVLESGERFRWVPPLGGVVCERCPGPPHDRTRLSLEGLKLIKAYQRLDIEALAALRQSPAVEREVETALREFVRHVLEREARSLPFLDEVRHAPVRRLMARVELRDIVTEADRAAALALEVAPGQDRFVESRRGIVPRRDRRRAGGAPHVDGPRR